MSGAGMAGDGMHSHDLNDQNLGDQSHVEQRQEIESQVRSVLIERRTQELAELFSDPENRKSIREAFIQSAIDHACLLAEGFFDMTPEEIRENETAEFEARIDEMLSDPEELGEVLAEIAQLEYASELDTRELLETVIAVAKDRVPSFPEETQAEIRVADERVCKLQESQKSVISLLSNLAAREGLNVATSEESFKGAIRELIPTAEQFSERYLEAARLDTKPTEDLEQIFTRTGTEAERVGKLYIRAMSSNCRIYEEIRKLELPKKLEEIYSA